MPNRVEHKFTEMKEKLYQMTQAMEAAQLENEELKQNVGDKGTRS